MAAVHFCASGPIADAVVRRSSPTNCNSSAVQNLPAFRLIYGNRLLRELADRGPATIPELLQVQDVEALFKGDMEHKNPARRASDLLRYAALMDLVRRDGQTWHLTDRGKALVDARGPDEWTYTDEQKTLLQNAITSAAAEGAELANDFALALDLLASAQAAKVDPADLGRALAVVRVNDAWKAKRTFESQGGRYAALLRDVGFINGSGDPTAAGDALLAAAQVPTHPPLEELLHTPVQLARWWWVNQGQTYKAERDEGILWAPLLNKRGTKLHHWETMAEVKEGDFILHYSQGFLRAASVVEAAAVLAPKPFASAAWEEDGRLVRTSYVDLYPAIALPEIPVGWRRAEGGPFTRDGAVQQGYLFPISDDFADQMLDEFPRPDLSRSTMACTCSS